MCRPAGPSDARNRWVVSGLLLLLVLVAGTSSVSAQVPQQSIYPDLTGQALIDKLRQEYAPTQTLGYDVARDKLYRYLDDNRGTLVGVYGGYSVDIPQGEDPSSFAYQNGSGISAEHTWPQSKGAGSEPQKSDMHNLFPVKQTINSARSNHPFDDIPDSGTDTWYRLDQSQSSIPTSSIDVYSETDSQFPSSTIYSSRFEVREDHKGNTARAMFYYYVVHNGTISDPDFFAAQEEELIEWHNLDDVDPEEVDRSEWIATQQGTNNPFVLDTTLVRRAFDASASGPTLQLASASESVSEGDGSFSLTVQLNSPDGNAVDADLALLGTSSADESDFGSYTTQTVSFGAGAADGATQTISITLTDDASAEGTESGVFALQNVQTSGGAAIGSPSATDVSVSDNDGTPSGLVISQVAEDGNVKGLELWNAGSASIDFSATPLRIERYANGSTTPTTDFTKNSGSLAAGEVLVVADGNANSIWSNEGIAFEQADLGFNGNDALEILVDGQRADVFGTIGSDPGSAWMGNGVSTADENLVLQSGITTGDTNGWTDPSTRFATAATAPLDDGAGADLYGFGAAPGSAACPVPDTQPTNLSLAASTGSIDASYDAASTADGYLVVRSQSSTLTGDPADGTTYSSGDALGGGTVVASTSATNVTAPGLDAGTTYTVFVFAQGTASPAGTPCTGGPAYRTGTPLTGSATTSSSSASALFTEPFDDASQYTITVGSDATDGTDNYFTRVDGTTIDKTYSGTNGPFFAGQDIDDPQVLGSETGQLTWTGIDISGASNLSFTGRFGEVLDGSGDIDDDDKLLVEYRIDGGSWTNLIAFRNNGASTNTNFLEDTDFDDVGDGRIISSSAGTMESFTKSIAGTGSTLDLRFTASIDSGDEDFAIDDFEVTGSSGSTVPSVEFVTNARSAAEGDAGTSTVDLDVTVASPDPNLSTSADVRVAGGTATEDSDFSFQPTSLTFPAGSSGPRSVPLTILGDTDVEGDETVVLEITNVTGGNGAVTGSPAQLTFTLTGDDAARPASGDLVIAEVMPDPDDVNDSSGEYFEVYNATGRVLDLDGWTIRDSGSDRHTIAGSVPVPAHGYALLCRDGQSPSYAGTPCDYVYGGDIAIANSTDELILENSSGTEVDRIEYTSSWPFSAGKSMVFAQPATANNNAESNWAEAAARQPGFDLSSGGTDAGSPGIRGTDQTLAVTQTAENVDGWRILAPPVSGLTLQWLVDNGAHVQGVTGAFPGADPNVYLSYDGAGSETSATEWTAAQSLSDALDPGWGFIWNPFGLDLPTTFTTTSSSSQPASDFTLTGIPTDEQWHVIGNPFPNPMRVSGINLAAQTFSTTLQVWDPSANSGVGTYRLRTQGVGDPRLDPMTGAWAQRASATGTSSSLTFAASAQSGTGAPFLKSSIGGSSPSYVRLSLTGEQSDGSVVTTDAAATLLFSRKAEAGWDVRDATKLTPITATYAALAFDGPEGATQRHRAVAAQPFPTDGRLEAPLRVITGGSPSASRYRIRWPDVELSAEWSVGLLDTETDSLVDLRTQTAYTFSASSTKRSQPAASGDSTQKPGVHRGTPAPKRPRPRPLEIIGNSRPKSGASATSSSRFVLIVTDGALPVELAGLDAQAEDERAVISWTTTSETGNAGFYVQRKRSGSKQRFEDLGFVQGRGTTEEAQRYTFETQPLPFGEHVFRLRQVDTDGADRLSKTVRLELRPDEPVALTPPAPNPSRTRATANLAVRQPQKVEVALYDLLGRRLRVLLDRRVNPGNAVQLKIPAGTLPSGTYFLRAVGREHTTTQRVTVVR
jgi:hypothetical protein